MFNRVLCVPCLGYQIPNFFYDIFERKSSQFLSTRGQTLGAGDPVFGWSVPIAKGPRKGFLGSLFSEPKTVSATMVSPVDGQLLNVNKYESFFSDKTPTTPETVNGIGSSKMGRPENIACFIATNDPRLVTAGEFYRPLVEALSSLLMTPHHCIEDVYRHYDFLNYEPLRDVVVKETSNLDKVIIPSIEIAVYEKLLTSGDISTAFFR